MKKLKVGDIRRYRESIALVLRIEVYGIAPMKAKVLCDEEVYWVWIDDLVEIRE